jgi:GNAT superfamily N-acetyltransferase
VNTVVMTLPLRDLPADLAIAPAPAPGLRLVERSIGEGIGDVHQLKGGATEFAARDSARQQGWQGGQIFLSLRSINGLAACGMARLADGHVGLFSLRTLPAEQGRGHARLLVAHLLAWGRAQGAHTGFLQVDENNAAAIAVYRHFGFAPRYAYWQRIGPTPAQENHE